MNNLKRLRAAGAGHLYKEMNIDVVALSAAQPHGTVAEDQGHWGRACRPNTWGICTACA